MSVSLRRPQTGEIKMMPEGWSWGCFFGCGILGIPLYRRGLQVWGSAMVAFNVVAVLAGDALGASGHAGRIAAGAGLGNSDRRDGLAGSGEANIFAELVLQNLKTNGFHP